MLHLYDTTRAGQESGAACEDGGGGGEQGMQSQQGSREEQEGGDGHGDEDNDEDDDDEEEEAQLGAGDGEGGGEGAVPPVKLTKAQRQLLLVPLAALKFGTGLLHTPSCLAFSHESDFLVAGTTGASPADLTRDQRCRSRCC